MVASITRIQFPPESINTLQSKYTALKHNTKTQFYANNKGHITHNEYNTNTMNKYYN
jgi:hypothetical protein